jgi:cAMP-dependent protein kinase regulator
LEVRNANAIPPLSKQEELELKRLNDRWSRIKEEKNKPPAIKITIEEEKTPKTRPQKKVDTDSSSDSDDDTETFSRSALLAVKPMAKKPPRSSVSAEVIGCFNKREDFKPIVIQKDDETKTRIKKRLQDCFMFKKLEDKDLNIVIDAMKEVKYKEGDVIIRQGDDGNELYVLESGECECYKIFPGDQAPRKLRDYIPGEAFGELALLYNAPRAASIKAAEDCTLFALDRQTFNNIVKAASKKNRDTYEEFLKSVDLLSSMDFYERVTLSDALKKVSFKKNEFIINEGEPGDSFYFVVEGKAVAQKQIDGETKNVMEYRQGDYFGERALLTNEPRAASIM